MKDSCWSKQAREDSWCSWGLTAGIFMQIFWSWEAIHNYFPKSCDLFTILHVAGGHAGEGALVDISPQHGCIMHAALVSMRSRVMWFIELEDFGLCCLVFPSWNMVDIKGQINSANSSDFLKVCERCTMKKLSSNPCITSGNQAQPEKIKSTRHIVQQSLRQQDWRQRYVTSRWNLQWLVRNNKTTSSEKPSEYI